MDVKAMEPGESVGVLADGDIRSAVARGELISAGFHQDGVQQSCYELRVGEVYYDLSSDEQRRYRIGADGVDDVLIKPFQRVVVITEETLVLPADVVGRILLKGKLFSLGLQPVNTYADPGFSGRLGLVLFNSSPFHIRLERGEPIAKIEFERLPRPVHHPYHGQHGFSAGIWPIPDHMYVSAKEARRDSRVEEPSVELRRAFGEDFGAMYDRLFGYGRLLLLFTVSYFFVATAIVVYGETTGNRISALLTIVLGLLTNIVSAVLIYLATTPRRLKKSR
ncbi:MAG TPA: hypothetical protein VF109_03090 [Mycobacteriales bacterium]